MIAYLIITTIICILLLAFIRFEGDNPNLTRIVSNGWCLSTAIIFIIALLSKNPKMTKQEAVTLLEACKIFIDRLATREIIGDIKNKKERDALIGFNKVWTANLLDDPDIQLQAGLSQKDITNLKYFLFQREAREMRLKYEIDNTRIVFAARYLLRQMDKYGTDYKLTEADRVTLRNFVKLMENHWVEENQDLDKDKLLLPAQIKRLNSLIDKVKAEEKVKM
jgi:hypothetical protein